MIDSLWVTQPGRRITNLPIPFPPRSPHKGRACKGGVRTSAECVSGVGDQPLSLHWRCWVGDKAGTMNRVSRDYTGISSALQEIGLFPHKEAENGAAGFEVQSGKRCK